MAKENGWHWLVVHWELVANLVRLELLPSMKLGCLRFHAKALRKEKQKAQRVECHLLCAFCLSLFCARETPSRQPTKQGSTDHLALYKPGNSLRRFSTFGISLMTMYGSFG